MAATSRQLHIVACMLSLFTLLPAVTAKLDKAHGVGSVILQDALRDMEDADMDILGAEDVHESTGKDTEAIMRQRLLAIDAERASLHRRLGLGQSAVEQPVGDDGLNDVFERLKRDLAPLMGPQMAQEMFILVLAGMLVYFATNSKTAPQTQPWKPAQSQTLDHFKAGSNVLTTARSMSHDTEMARLPATFDLASQSANRVCASELPATIESESSLLRPPPGLELDFVEEVAAAPSCTCTSHGPAIQYVSDAAGSDPGAPPGLECMKTSALSSGKSDGLEVQAPGADVALPTDAQEMVAEEQHHPYEEHAKPQGQAAGTAESLPVSITESRKKRNKSAKLVRETKPSSDAGLAPKAAVKGREVDQSHGSCSTVGFRDWLPTLFQKQAPVLDDEFIVPEKAGKRKVKQQLQRPSAQKCSEEASCKKPFRSSWGMRWPCSLPMTAALVTMLFIVLAGRISGDGSDSLSVAEQDLAEKREQLEQLKRRHSSYSLRLALLQLEEFQEEALSTLALLPAGQGSKLESARADAANLREALRDITDDEFPQVEDSFQNVYVSWKRTLSAAKQLSGNSKSEESLCSQPA